MSSSAEIAGQEVTALTAEPFIVGGGTSPGHTDHEPIEQQVGQSVTELDIASVAINGAQEEDFYACFVDD